MLEKLASEKYSSLLDFTTLHFLPNFRISPISPCVTLHYARSPANNEYFSLLVQFVSYKENNVLNMAPGTLLTTLHFLCNLQIG